MQKPKPKRRVYKPMRFGEGMQPGTVEWELNKRRLSKEQREDNRQWAEMEAMRERETHSPQAGVLARILSPISRFGSFLGRVSGLIR
jgi:hypothetical protein